MALLTIRITHVQAGEGPRNAPLLEQVRMSTHIVVGIAKGVRVVSAISGKEVTRPGADLKDGEKLEIELEVQDILQSSISASMQTGDKVRVMTGSPRMTVSVFRKALMNGPSIYFLCRDAEHSPRLDYHFPFFGIRNLAVSMDKLGEGKIIINRLKEASQ